MPLDTGYHDRRLERRLQDRDFRENFERAQVEIQQIDSIMRMLDERREALGMSKAELARRIDKNPASVRRLFTSESNPELGTVAAMAAALGCRISLVPQWQTRSRARTPVSA